MPKPISIPIVAVGPGSQPEEDEELAYMAMPTDMYTHDNLSLPEPEDLRPRHRVRALIEGMLATARASGARPDSGGSFNLLEFDADDLDCINQILGEGEVSINIERGRSRLLAQESVLTGVWRVRQLEDADAVVADHIEVGDVPQALRTDGFAAAPGSRLRPGPPIPGVQNAPALLSEIADRMASYVPGHPSHVINLTLLPLTREDLIHLGTELGVGPASILSRGYGNCRVGATAYPNVWWVKYFNSQDALILNTIEIVDIPAIALAAPEDLEDTAERLSEILAVFE